MLNNSSNRFITKCQILKRSTVAGEDGITRTMLIRDSNGQQPHRKAAKLARRDDSRVPALRSCDEPQGALAPRCQDRGQTPQQSRKRRPAELPSTSNPVRRRVLAEQSWQLRQEVEAETQVANWLSRLELKTNPDAPSAAERLQAIRSRVREMRPGATH